MGLGSLSALGFSGPTWQWKSIRPDILSALCWDVSTVLVSSLEGLHSGVINLPIASGFQYNDRDHLDFLHIYNYE